MTLFAIALGSNLGDRIDHLRAAVGEVRALGEVPALAGVYETAPVGGPEQGPYLNSVLLLDSELAPEALLNHLAAIEAAHGRERIEHWGPRTLDLDIVASDGPSVRGPDLEIPHPRARERRFVLEPLSEIWPEAPVGEGETAAFALPAVITQDLDLLERDWVNGDRAETGRYWVVAQVAIIVAILLALIGTGSWPDSGPEPYRLVGVALLIGGGFLTVVSARVLGSALIPLPQPAPGASMVEDGMYRLARHPIYGGIATMLLGLCLAFSSALGAFISLVLFGFFWAKSEYEERLLRIAYPAYSGYRRRVVKRMIPFII
jgi:2-amino-4-hydroxy-6-hydroxymethyldihydropteridine diphosphokinase